jgi:hypothetical protein
MNISPLRGFTRPRILFERVALSASQARQRSTLATPICVHLRSSAVGFIRAHSSFDSRPFVVLFLCLFAAILYPLLTLKSPQGTSNDFQSGRTAKAV